MKLLFRILINISILINRFSTSQNTMISLGINCILLLFAQIVKKINYYILRDNIILFKLQVVHRNVHVYLGFIEYENYIIVVKCIRNVTM